MNCHSAREIFPDLLDRRTPASAQPEARAHLATCPDCQREFSALSQTLSALDAMPAPTPSPRLRQNFYAMLEEEKHSAESVRTSVTRDTRARRLSFFAWAFAPFAACALIAVGFVVGSSRTAKTYKEGEVATQQQVEGLRSQITDLQKAMLVTLIRDQEKTPTNERLQEVLAAAKDDKATDKVLSDLVAAVNSDPSTNVRLRALEALFPYADNKSVRDGILASLPREQNPLVQIEMIEFVATTKNPDAAPTLEKLSQNNTVDRSVRDAAYRALAQL
jgi:hypothetical protein